MPPGPEDIAREQIDRMLVSAGWDVQDAKAVNLYAKQGVAIRELKSGHGTADYLLYVDGRAAGVIEAKKAGATLTGVELQSAKYSNGLPDSLPAWTRPLPFVTNQQALKPGSRTASIPSLVPARYSSFTSRKPLLTG
jgi:type I restriction enzyme R subunit